MVNYPDTHFGMKKLGLHNWTIPDVPKFFSITETTWLSQVMEPQLIEAVPDEIKRLFEVARGSILYGWFFYPLLTLASEQLYRVQEAALKERCKIGGIKTYQLKKNGDVWDRKFSDLINDLHKAGLIDDEARSAWDNVRSLRNLTSHPERQSINVPSAAVASIAVCARRINHLFAGNPDFYTHLGERVRRAVGLDRKDHTFPIVVGIDVGGVDKGYHLAALRGAEIIGTLQTTSPEEATGWCVQLGAKIIAVDAPSGWSKGGEYKSREAERILAHSGISSYPTPVRAAADERGVHAWMINGERLYYSLKTAYRLFAGESAMLGERFCFETYPHAAVCAFAKIVVSAKNKKQDRPQLLRAAGLDITRLVGDDFVDAALCALVANCASVGYVTCMGNAEEGFIVCPS